MRRIVLLLAGVAILPAVAGCGQNSPSPTTSPSASVITVNSLTEASEQIAKKFSCTLQQTIPDVALTSANLESFAQQHAASMTLFAEMPDGTRIWVSPDGRSAVYARESAGSATGGYAAACA